MDKSTPTYPTFDVTPLNAAATEYAPGLFTAFDASCRWIHLFQGATPVLLKSFCAEDDIETELRAFLTTQFPKLPAVAQAA